MLCCSPICALIRSWLRDYEKIQAFALFLIYIQIGCALLGSLGAQYNGVILIHLVVSLFALIAIESSSQSLGRTYAALLGCSILIDVAWFILFSHEIWCISRNKYGSLFVFSVRLTLWMQMIGFSVRLLSSFLWIQIYRLGASSVDDNYKESDCDLRTRFLNPSSHVIVRQNSASDDILGGSIYDPAYYATLFEDAKDNGHAYGDDRQIVEESGGSTSTDGSSQLKFCISRSFQVFDDVSVVATTPQSL